jgi:sigma-B regulation protein RsbU (phosphoserine phosphatase)
VFLKNEDQNNESKALLEENKRLRNAVAELAVLNDVATTINSTQPVEKIIDHIVKKCVKHLNVEQGVVMLLDAADEVNPLHTMIREQQSSSKILPYRFDAQLTGWMLKKQAPLLVNNLTKDERFKEVVEQNTPFQSLLSVPLKIKNRMIGVLTVFNKRSEENFSPDDQKLLSIIASQSAQIIENSRLMKKEQNLRIMEEEMRLARITQENLLPKNLPHISGYQISAKTISAQQVGGDYYDFIRIDDLHFAFCVGDISGKGMPAAMLMSNLQATLRSHLSPGKSSKEIITSSNNLLYNSTESTKFATLFFGIINIASKEITYCNAGHNSPYYYKKDLSYSELLAGGIILGCLPGSAYEEEIISLGNNELILIYSDGITEAMNKDNEEYGEERLRKVMQTQLNQSPDIIIDKIIADVKDFTVDTPQSDDMTLMIIKRDKA